jgi:hypothetical protein
MAMESWLCDLKDVQYILEVHHYTLFIRGWLKLCPTTRRKAGIATNGSTCGNFVVNSKDTDPLRAQTNSHSLLTRCIAVMYTDSVLVAMKLGMRNKSWLFQGEVKEK